MSRSEIIKEYANECRIVRETDDFGEETYHYEGPLGRFKSFHSLDDARLYADVYTVVDSFREEKTGERGVPPAIARAREDVLMAYLAADPTMSVTWVAQNFDLPEDRVREYIRSLQNRAAQQRESEG